MGYAVLLVHHTNKSGDQRGASIIEVPMDYIIKLSHPPKGDAIFKKGAFFNVEFTKVRNKEPKNSDFQCELLEKEDGRLEFAVNTSMTEVPDDMELLRAIAEGHVRPNVRYFARKLDYSVGKIDKLLKNLRKEEAIEKKRYVTTERGKCMLHEWFSQKYPAPESYEEYKNEIPF